MPSAVSEISRTQSLEAYRGKTLAVDAYVWLHRGVYACAQEVALNQPTLKYVTYAMGKIRMLQYFGIKPYVVFDGGLLPNKMGTERERQRKRSEALAKANALQAQGKTQQAREHYVKACDVSPLHAYQLIKELKRQGIPYLVAPYEADAQLAYLEKHGMVDGIITEDSDMVVFGCKLVLYKLNSEAQVVEIDRARLPTCRMHRFDGWSDTEFRHMAILSGCDYLDSIPGLGLKTAHRLMRRHRTVKKVIQSLRLNSKLAVPPTYDQDFRRADLTFLYQCVFDPRTNSLTHLNDIPLGMSEEDLASVGAQLSQDLARGIATGDVDPITRRTVVDILPQAHDILSKAHRVSQSASRKPKQAAAPEKGVRDIRNFFSSTPMAARPRSTRPALGRVPVNAPQTAPAPVLQSKFFGGPANQAAEVETIVVSDSEPEIEELPITADDEQAFLLANVDEDEDLEIEKRWTEDQLTAATEEEGELDLPGGSGNLDERPATPEDPSPGGDTVVMGRSASGQLSDVSLTDPLTSPPKCSAPPSPLSQSSAIQQITSPTRSLPLSPSPLKQASGRTAIPTPPRLPLSPRKPMANKTANNLKRKATLITSEDISDPSEPATPVPLDAKPWQLHQKLAVNNVTPVVPKPRVPKQRRAAKVEWQDSDDDETLKSKQDAVAAGWRAKFMLSSSSSNASPGIKTAVAKAVVAGKRPRLSGPLPAKPSSSAKASRKSLPVEPASTPSDSIEDEPLPWQKVAIHETKLKQFVFKR